VPADLQQRAQRTAAPDTANADKGVPDGATFEHRQHASSHGSRAYRIFRPTSGRPIRGLVMMLHGCTQTPADFAVGTGMNAHAEQHGLIVVYPEQTAMHNASRCWNWFRPEDQGRAGGEPAMLADLAASVAATHDVPTDRVFVAGLSAGGAMAAILAQTHPDIFSGAGIHSGLAPRSAKDVVSAFGAMRGEPLSTAEAMRAPAIIFHGSADTTVAPLNAGRLAGQLDQTEQRAGDGAKRRFDVLSGRNEAGRAVEVWRIDGAGHAWSGGHPNGTYTDPDGPDASAEMVRFFMSLT
jgi:poly(hydroxyalkanoate) depolymerase family esterase